MEPIISPWILYVANIIPNIGMIAITGSIAAGVLLLCALIGFFLFFVEDEFDDVEKVKAVIKPLIKILAVCLTPNM